MTISNRYCKISITVAVACAVFTIDQPVHAFEFQHMETDKFYQTTVRDIIEKEFIASQALLELKATSLSMEIRPVDIKRLKSHLREKAFLLGSCFDAAIDMKNTARGEQAKAFGVDCVKQGLEIKNQIERNAFSEWGMTGTQLDMSSLAKGQCLRQSTVDRVQVFDFLKDSWSLDYPVGSVIDYHRAKRCIVRWPLS